MQLAKALQYSTGHAEKASQYRSPTSDAITCLSYWETPVLNSDLEKYSIKRINKRDLADALNSIQYNTKLRKEAEDAFQQALDGGVIDDNNLRPDKWIKNVILMSQSI